MTIIAITQEPLDVRAHEAAAGHSGAGATVVFTGVVRNVDHDRSVTELEYHAHPSAQETLDAIVAEFADDPAVLGIAVSHRVGTLQIGDVALVAAVSSEHRAEAFNAAARLVD